ncbi:MAG: DUF2178 domain-containing protein [Patescibacteria group bacterium]
MTLKKFTSYRMLAVILLSAAVSAAIVQQNYLLALVAMAVAMIALYLLRQRVTDVIADERDYAIAGQASRYTITVFSLASVAVMFVILSAQSDNQTAETIAYLLAYLVCALMLLNSFIFRFLSLRAKIGRISLKEKIKAYLPYFLIALILSAIIIIGGLRFFSGEDAWICADGAWVRHGQPSAPQPSAPCQ